MTAAVNSRDDRGPPGPFPVEIILAGEPLGVPFPPSMRFLLGVVGPLASMFLSWPSDRLGVLLPGVL